MGPKMMQLPMRGVMPIITTAFIFYFINAIFPIGDTPFAACRILLQSISP
jgi:hypothetical protein